MQFVFVATWGGCFTYAFQRFVRDLLGRLLRLFSWGFVEFTDVWEGSAYVRFPLGVFSGVFEVFFPCLRVAGVVGAFIFCSNGCVYEGVKCFEWDVPIFPVVGWHLYYCVFHCVPVSSVNVDGVRGAYLVVVV